MKYIPTKNFWPDRFDRENNIRYIPKALVLHITDSSSRSAMYWFQDPASNASSHYLVQEDGEVMQFVYEKDAAWHAGKSVRPTWKRFNPKVNSNWVTIGIEVAITGPYSLPGWKQWTETAKLVKSICQKYGWPMDPEHVVNHNEIHAGKSCPGQWSNRFYISLLSKF